MTKGNGVYELVKSDGTIWKSLSYRKLADVTTKSDSRLKDVGPLTVVEIVSDGQERE